MLKNSIYFLTLLNNEHNLEEDINHRILMGNRCSFGLFKQMQWQILKRKTKYKQHKTIILLRNLSASESWSLNRMYNEMLGLFKGKFLRRISGVIQIKRIWWRCYNFMLYSLFNPFTNKVVSPSAADYKSIITLSFVTRAEPP